MGELAKMFNAERGINAKLTVVQMDGWQRGDWFDSTGIEWVNPSPNLRSVTEAALYPGVGLIEGTNISVGRGTDTPFEVVGAPWIKSKEFAAYLNARGIAGVRFVPVTFTPTSSNYSGQACQGVNIVLTDRNGFDGPEMGVELAAALLKLYANNWKIEKMQQLLVNQSVYEALATGQDPRRISQDWREETAKVSEGAGEVLDLQIEAGARVQRLDGKFAFPCLCVPQEKIEDRQKHVVAAVGNVVMAHVIGAGEVKSGR